MIRALKVPSIIIACYRSAQTTLNITSFHIKKKKKVNYKTCNVQFVRGTFVLFLFLFSVVSSAASLGFIQATLEPHMRDFHLSPLAIGSMFVITGACYGQ